MKPGLHRLLNDHGMVGVLLLLCAFFSLATLQEQAVTGGAAAAQVSAQIQRQFGKSARVLIAARTVPEDAAFVRALREHLGAAGVQVVDAVQGDPKEAREALVRAAAAGAKLDAIACTQTAAGWLVFAGVKDVFPALGDPALITPRSYRWPNFLKADNLLNIANQIAVIAIVAIGMTMVIITGCIDLSVGSLIALSAVLTAVFIRDWAGGVAASTTGMTAASLAAIATCGAVGAFSGLMITRFRIPPFIVTLAMMLVASGLAYTLAQGQSIAAIPDSFVWLGRDASLPGLPNAVLLMLLLYALAHGLMTQTRIGRHIYAVGGNRDAAHLSGVPVGRVLMFVFVVCGLLAGLGGVVMASQLKSGSATYGSMYELYVIAAVVVGGASLDGGSGRMAGTLVGAFTIAVIQNGMNLTNVESYTQKVVLGLVILGAVLLDKWRKRL